MEPLRLRFAPGRPGASIASATSRKAFTSPASIRDPNVALASEPFIRLDRTGWAGRLVDGYLRHARIRPKERFELDGLEAITIMVDRGLGVSLVPDWSPPWPEGLSLRKLPVPGAPTPFRCADLNLWSHGSPRKYTPGTLCP